MIMRGWRLPQRRMQVVAQHYLLDGVFSALEKRRGENQVSNWPLELRAAAYLYNSEVVADGGSSGGRQLAGDVVRDPAVDTTSARIDPHALLEPKVL